jgi:hypothetical protein
MLALLTIPGSIRELENQLDGANVFAISGLRFLRDSVVGNEFHPVCSLFSHSPTSSQLAQLISTLPIPQSQVQQVVSALARCANWPLWAAGSDPDDGGSH